MKITNRGQEGARKKKPKILVQSQHPEGSKAPAAMERWGTSCGKDKVKGRKRRGSRGHHPHGNTGVAFCGNTEKSNLASDIDLAEDNFKTRILFLIWNLGADAYLVTWRAKIEEDRGEANHLGFNLTREKSCMWEDLLVWEKSCLSSEIWLNTIVFTPAPLLPEIVTCRGRMFCRSKRHSAVSQKWLGLLLTVSE